ncbi:hypothetical protein KVT40_002310 [Elsinoe batatas]|uniref:Uncharacterized protein n=1 Tax=Elsinoe batatas TaxID=2601811 RepID=A0A8K0PI29_9PEZI|nr:hypothetical protein KVT40_002310 [Elsinoe batatas]
MANGWEVVPATGCVNASDGQPCQNVLCQPLPEWRCPEENLVRSNPGYSVAQSFAPLNGVCLSNCSLKGTDEACCQGSFKSPSTCMDTSSALKSACQHAYSYTYDDIADIHLWRWDPANTRRLLTLISCPSASSYFVIA